MSVLAVCPHCNKNIELSSEAFEPCNCPICAGNLTPEFIKIKDGFVDLEESGIAYETGKQYFDNTDFRTAKEHFSKAIKLNPNHYLSFYYAGLCDIYENDSNPEYDIPLNLMKLLKYSLIKLDNSQHSMDFRVPFVRSIYKEICSMLVAEFNKNAIALDEKESRSLRHKLVLMSKHVGAFTIFDKEYMLLFDPEASLLLLNIIDVGVASVVKSVAARIVDGKQVVAVSDDDYQSAEKIFDSLVNFARGIDPAYSLDPHRPEFESVILHNKSIMHSLQQYNYSLGKKNKKACLSLTGEILNSVLKSCLSGVKFSYDMLFKSLYVKKNDPVRTNILLQGLELCLEILKPRIHFDGYRKLHYNAKGIKKIQNISNYMMTFLDELMTTNKKKTALHLMNEFYALVSKGAKLYYSNVVKTYSVQVNRIKSGKGKEFLYYSAFLYNVMCSSALCLEELIYIEKYKCKDKKAILKIGKQASEELLLLFDYNYEMLERDQNFSDTIKIYNSILANL